MVTPPRRLLILHHPQISGSVELAQAIATHLQTALPEGVTLASIDDLDARARLADNDMLVVLGGDGSMLRGGRLAAQHGLPILGVDLGRLGFLLEAQPDEWREVLDRILAGDYRIEERMMLRIEHYRDGELCGSYEALNEAVVGRGALARPVRLKTLIDGGDLTTYVADGLIVATPTGSTAYALAVGGPILPPELKNILLIAIAPHLSMDRAIVLAQGSTVEIIARHDHQAILSADGQVEVHLLDGDHITVRMSHHVARFIRVRPPAYFYTMLMSRMTHNPSANKAK